MTIDDFLGWLAYDRIHPISELGEEILSAKLLQILSNFAGKDYKVIDFLPSFYNKHEPQSIDDIVKNVEILRSYLEVNNNGA